MSRALAIAAAQNRTNKENVPATQPVALCDIRRHSGLFAPQKSVVSKGAHAKRALTESALSPQCHNSPGDTGNGWIVDAQLESMRKEMTTLEQKKAALEQQVLASRKRIQELERERDTRETEHATRSAAAQRELDSARSQHAIAMASAAAAHETAAKGVLHSLPL